MSELYWERWQLDLLDEYILGYTSCNTQEELAELIGKSLNAVKIKLSRRRSNIQEEERDLTFDEYKLFLSNRFDKTTEEIAKLINCQTIFLLNELDEIDNLEASELFEEGYRDRVPSIDELKVFIRLYEKGRNGFQIAHILNRPIEKVHELIDEYSQGIL